MFEPFAILTFAGAFLISVWLSLLAARVLMSALLASMHHGARRGTEAALMPASTKKPLKINVSTGKPLEDSPRR